MMIECEIAALRAFAFAVLSSGGQADCEKFLQVFERRFREWLEEKRSQALSTYCAFSQTARPEALSALARGWRLYEAFTASLTQVTEEKLFDLTAIFWGRCIEGYTNQKIEAFIPKGELAVDGFSLDYVTVQLRLAKAARIESAPLTSGPR